MQKEVNTASHTRSILKVIKVSHHQMELLLFAVLMYGQNHHFRSKLLGNYNQMKFFGKDISLAQPEQSSATSGRILQ